MKRHITLSIVLALLAVLWVVTGTIETAEEEAPEATNSSVASEDSSDPSADQANHEAFKVHVKTLAAEKMVDRLSLQGQIEAARVVELKAEATGVVNRIDTTKGAQLNQGQVILALDLSDRIARLEEAKAILRVREIDVESGKKLLKRNLLSNNQQEQNLANLAAARAQVKAIQVEIDNTISFSPFDGRLNELYVEIGDYVSHGDPIAQIVDNIQAKISVDVPQQYIGSIELGQSVRAETLDGETIEGLVSYISSSASQSTRTFRIEAKVNKDRRLAHFGQSARVVISLGERAAHKISPSLLDLNSEGNLQVKAVDGDSRVVVLPVEIVRSESDGVWLSGLPDSLQLITVGQGFVAEGQTVEAVEANEKGEATL